MSSKGKRLIHQYSEPSLHKALQEIRQGTITIREASRKFGVPRGTLQDRLHGRVPEGPRKMGPNTVLTSAEEKKLVEWLTDLSKCGFPRKIDDLLNTVKKIIDNDKRKNPFKDGRPGKKWYSSFLKRNPEIVVKEAEGVSKGRAIVTEQTIRKWFTDLKDYLQEHNVLHILSDPKRILNGDETSFCMCPKTGKVLAPKGWKNVYQIQQGNEKETITVLLVFTANGDIVSPMVVFPYVRPTKDVINSMPADWFLGRSDSGWMKSELFFEYIANGVNKWLEQNSMQKPVILFVDGHKTHLTMELSEFCSNNDIILYALPPNATHIMQPADVSVFKPLKSGWKRTVRRWQAQPENINSVLTKSTFAPLLATVLKESALPETIKNGFRKCGIYPYNPDDVDYSKCIQNTIENVQKHLNNAPTPLLQPDDFCIAEKVIQTISSNLTERGIDTKIILEEIRKSKSLLVSKPFSDPYSVSEFEIEDLTLPIIEVDHLSGIKPGLYDITENGILTAIENHDSFNNLLLSDNNTQTKEHFHTSHISGTENECSLIQSTATQGPVVDMENNEQGDPKNSSFIRNSNSVSPAFENHLFYPKPIIRKGKIKNCQDRAPSAISSAAWRDFIKSKEEEKERKQEEINKRKEERLKRKAEKQMKKKIVKKQKSKHPWEESEEDENCSDEEHCASCNGILMSDEDDDSLKSVGCDNCPRWFHLKCTDIFDDKSYDTIANIQFICNLCKPT